MMSLALERRVIKFTRPQGPRRYFWPEQAVSYLLTLAPMEEIDLRQEVYRVLVSSCSSSQQWSVYHNVQSGLSGGTPQNSQYVFHSIRAHLKLPFQLC